MDLSSNKVTDINNQNVRIIEENNKIENQNEEILQKFPSFEYKQVSLFKNLESSQVAINIKQSILLIGGGQLVKLFTLKNKVKLIQKLIVPTKLRTICLNSIIFMNKSNQFITQSHHTFDYTSICIWSQNIQAQWDVQYFIELGSIINQIILNKNEDLLISLDEYGYIKFWSKNLNWKNSTKIELEEKFLKHMILNQSETKLICATNDNKIFIIENLNNGQWQVMQNFTFQFEILHSFFYQNDVLIFKLCNQDFLTVFIQESTTNEYQQFKSVSFLSSDSISTILVNGRMYFLSQRDKTLEFIAISNNYEESIILKSIELNYKQEQITFTDNQQYMINVGDEQVIQIRRKMS